VVSIDSVEKRRRLLTTLSVVVAQAFVRISTAVKLAESGLQSDIPANCRVFLAVIKAVETDVLRALDIQPDVSSLLLNDRGKKSWINGVIQSNLKESSR